jgi:hypothetical protein
MEIDDPKIVALREKVTAAQQEFDMAVTFHEVWKPAAYDKDLHSRMGNSFASQAFLITRTALRREMVLALTPPMGHQQAIHSDAVRCGHPARERGDRCLGFKPSERPRLARSHRPDEG